MKLLISILYIVFLGVAAHFVGESLPRKKLNENKFPFKLYSFEHNGKIYEFIGIKKWKDKMPDMSKVCKDMVPKRVKAKLTVGDADILIKETCVAEFIHLLLCVFSLGVYFIWKNKTGIFLSIVCVLGNVPFIIIQRYNRPKFIRLRDKILKREILCGV